MNDDEIVAAMAGWRGHRLMIEHDKASGAWIILAVHAVRQGRFDGGTRIKTYDAVAMAARDAMRLAEAMSYKWAVHQIPCGGAKGVIMLPSGADRAAVLRRYGAMIRDWNGAFSTASDMGSSSADLDIVAEEAGGAWVYGSTRYPLGAGDSAVITAIGLEASIRATAEALGRPGLGGTRVAVQGVGKIGRSLIDMLVKAGASVIAADTRPSALAGLRENGVEIADPEEILFAECDVLAPCAAGGVLKASTIAELRCRAVVGGANNQLATEEDADRLADRGILYGPDFVVNGGGAIADLGMVELGWSQPQALERASEIGQTLAEIYALAGKAEITTHEAALRRAREFLG